MGIRRIAAGRRALFDLKAHRKAKETWEELYKLNPLEPEALSLGAQNFTLLALWDGVKTEGLGGTYHMRAVAEQYVAALVTVYTTDLLKADAASQR